MRVAFYKPLVRPEFMFDQLRSIYLGFRTLKAYVRAFEPDSSVAIAHTREGIVEARPDVIGLSSSTEMWGTTTETVRWLREGSFAGPIIVGGPHVTALPETLPDGADCAVVGDGEATFLELIRAYRAGRRPSLADIPGIAYREPSGELVRTEPRAPLDMDSLPVDLEDSPAACFQISTVRGCPYRCAHCVEGSTQGRPRFLSAEKLLWIMRRRAALTGNHQFFFQDDTFLAAPGRLERLHALVRAENLMGKFRVRSVSLNANLVREETIPLLKDIGAQRLGMGAESFDPGVLGAVKGGVVSLEDIDRTIRWAEKAGLPLGASQVYGFPGETRGQMIESIKRVIRYERVTPFRHWVCYVCQPLPGSLLWEKELARGRVSLDMDFSSLRIDGDCRFFSSPWWYGNEDNVPREEFLDILARYGMLPANFFVPESDPRAHRRARGGRLRRLARKIYHDVLRAIGDRRREGRGGA